jgi:hypothetical protein
MLFGIPFQAPDRVGGLSDEPPAKDHLQEPTPPTWRELNAQLNVVRHELGSTGVI